MNHNGDVDLAKTMIDAAHTAGADAVKFQMFDSEAYVHSTVLSRELDAHGNPLPKKASLKAIEFSFEEWTMLRDYAQTAGILFFVTPFDLRSVDWVRQLGLPLVKIASGDSDYLPLIRACARLKIPTILSTGMTSLGEIDTAVAAYRATGGEDLIVLQCVSAYPADPADSNVAVIPAMMERYGVPSGLSDHCTENAATFAAIALGGSVVEKHFTTDRSLPGVDQAMSLDPIDFKAMVDTCRQIEAAMGSANKAVLDKEQPVRAIARRSLFAKRDIKTGERFDPLMLVALRPAGGVPVSDWDLVMQQSAARDIAHGQMLTIDDLA